MARTLRELFVKYAVDATAAIKGSKDLDAAADDVKEAMEAAEKAGGQLTTTLKGVGTIAATASTAILGAATAVTAFVGQWSKHAVQVSQTAKQFGVSTEFLTGLQYAAESFGVEGETVIETLKEMNLRIAEVAQTGSGSAGDALKLLRIDAKELAAMKPEDQLFRLVDALEGVKNTGSKTFLLDALFGEQGGIKAQALFSQGTKQIRELIGEAKDLGITLSDDAAAGASKLNQEMARGKALFTAVKNDLAISLLPVVTQVAKETFEWGRANKEVLTSGFKSLLSDVVTLAREIGPLIVDAAEGTAELSDSVGGLSNAVKIGAGVWVTWKLAALGAINSASAALAVFTASFAAGMAIAKSLSGSGEKDERNARDISELDRLKRLTSRQAYEDALPDTNNPTVDRARQRFHEIVKSFDIGGGLTGFDVGQKRTKKQQQQIEARFKRAEMMMAELDAAYAAAGAGADIPTTPDPSADPTRLGSIGGSKSTAITLESLLREAKESEKELANLVAIRAKAEEKMRAAVGTERLRYERIVKDLNEQITGQKTQGINEMIAEALGQGTGLGAGALKPAGLGTTIMQIDASLHFDLGGLKVELPSSILRKDMTAEQAGHIAGNSITEALRQWAEDGYRKQRGQIIG